MKVQLIRMHADESQEAIQLQEFPVIVGRSSDAGVQIVERWVSRRHCDIDIAKESPVVLDLGSRNGTCINGHPIQCSPLLTAERLEALRKALPDLYAYR